MEALGIFRFWRNTAVRADVSTEDEFDDTDGENSLFDLPFHARGASRRREPDPKKEARFTESPRDVFPSHRKPRSPDVARRSAPKFRVFMLGFKKSTRHAEIKVFGRGNCDCDADPSVVVPSSSDKSVPKYLKLIKPFYVKSSGKGKPPVSVAPSSSPATATVTPPPGKFGEVSRVGSFKIVTRSLGKSRSASTGDGAAPPSIRRRDESLLEQQRDGIQGAILHCKRSYTNSSSSGAPSDEQKRCSI